MPRANKESTLARQWELMMLLPSRPPGKTARSLRDSLEAAGHFVTKRTVERDLVELSGIFPLLSNEISKPFGWYWTPGATLNIPGMDLAEAMSLGLLEDLLRQLIPACFFEALDGRFTEARSKLAALSGNPHAQWAERVRYIPPGIPFLPPEVSPSTMRGVQDALLQQHQIRIEYTSAGADTSKEMQLHPLALIQQGVRTYLLATAFEHNTPQFYAVHRMNAVEVLDQPALHPKGFSLEDYMSRSGGLFGAGKSMTLKAKLSENLADLLAETPLAEDQKILHRQGSRTLTVTVVDSWQLRFWILSQGPSIIVQQPKALRKDVVSQLEQTLALYSDNRPSL